MRILQILLESASEKEQYGREIPNLVYVSREKRKSTLHNYKAGALNVLVTIFFYHCHTCKQNINLHFLLNLHLLHFHAILSFEYQQP